MLGKMDDNDELRRIAMKGSGRGLFACQCLTLYNTLYCRGRVISDYFSLDRVNKEFTSMKTLFFVLNNYSKFLLGCQATRK
jgi:hypothetical protein